jgi:hypothetical protein
MRKSERRLGIMACGRGLSCYTVLKEHIMAWVAICLPFMAVGVVIATVPIIFATHHQHKYGHHGSYPDRQTAQGTATASTGDLTLCPQCSALVADRVLHHNSVHAADVPIA